MIYDNGSSGDGMDIDLQTDSASAGLTSNDPGDVDVGPNQFQNFPVPTDFVYTGPGAISRPAIVTGTLDTSPGFYRVDVCFSPTISTQGGRGRAVTLLRTLGVVVVNGPTSFSTTITVPDQIATGGISFTATSSTGNTSEISTAISTVSPLLFSNGLE